jgi:hypothetical protein
MDSQEGPFTSTDIRNLSLAVDIYQSIGGLKTAVSYLQDVTKSNIEKIDHLSHSFLAIPGLERAVGQNAKDLNEVGRRHDKNLHELEMRLEQDVNELGRQLGKDVNELATRHDNKIHELEKFDHTTQTIGWVAISLAGVAVTVLGYFLHFLASHIVFK